MADQEGPSIAADNKFKTKQDVECCLFLFLYSHKPQCRASSALQCTAESNACLLCTVLCCLICLLQETRHSRASHDMQFDIESSACTAFERMHVHTGHTAGSPNTAMHSWEQCLSVTPSILLSDYLAARLRHSFSTCSESEITACRAYTRQHFYRPQSRASSALQCTAESNTCLLSDRLAATSQAQLSFSTCSVTQKCLRLITACRASERMHVHTGPTFVTVTKQDVSNRRHQRRWPLNSAQMPCTQMNMHMREMHSLS